MPLFGGPPDVEKMRAKRDVKGLIKALSYQKDADVRKNAAVALGQIADAQAVEPLIVATQDADPQVREAALHALGEIGDARTVEPLITALKNESQGVRKAAARALDRLGWQPDRDQAGVQFWILLERWDRCAALGALAVEPLIAALKDNKDEWVIPAIKALGQISDVRAVDPLIDALKTAGPDVRTAAAQALGQIGDTRTVDPLIAALKNTYTNVNIAAAQALGQIGDTRAVDPLIDILKYPHPHAELKIATAQALGQIGDVRAVKPLSDALNQGVSFAIEGLKQFGNAGMEALIAALVNRSSKVRKSAAEALVQLGWKPDQDQTRAQYWVAQQNWDKCVAIGAPAVEPLIATLKDLDDDISRAAARALGQIGAAAVIPLLIASNEEPGWIGRHVDAVMEQIGTDAVEPLIAALKDENEDLRCAAAKALVHLYQLRQTPAQLKQIIRAERDLITKQGWHWTKHGDVTEWCGGNHDDSRTEGYSNVQFPL